LAPARPIPTLECSDSFRAAALKTVQTRFEEMASFTAAALEGRDEHGVHDMRVASRRLRAALELFKDALLKKHFTPVLRDVKRLADSLGAVRDSDVLIARLKKDKSRRSRPQQKVLREMIGELSEKRRLAREELESTILDVENSEFSHHLQRLLGLEGP
jgi:CHAD domain-containing protein